MITVHYKCLRTDVLHTEQCGNVDDAYHLMTFINLASDLRGISVHGDPKFFCGATGVYYNTAGQPLGREKKVGV